MLKEADVVKLLNRALTQAETDNFKMYLKIATQRLEELLCMNLTSGSEERTYEARKNYRTVYVDPFTDLTSVTIDGDVVDAEDYVTKQNDNLNASWYNIIEFDKVRSGEKIVVDADWGFGSCPYDLQLLLAKLFALNSSEQTQEAQVKSKKIEDFSVTYKDSATFDDLALASKSTIDKYGYCNQGYIRHGVTYGLRPVYHD